MIVTSSNGTFNIEPEEILYVSDIELCSDEYIYIPETGTKIIQSEMEVSLINGTSALLKGTKEELSQIKKKLLG